MIYLDYSATTPVDVEVLNTFNKVSLDFIGNPNSLHKLGIKSKNLIDQATEQIAELLKVNSNEIIYTSGSSESNNLAIKGICLKYKNRGKHIITTRFEHSSIYGPINYLLNEGYDVDFVETNEFGIVDLNHLKALIKDETILISINSVNSEIGIIQPIEEIAEIVKSNSKCFLHVDMTQSIGKIDIDIKNIDLISFSAHKFYGLKGIGCLVKKDKVQLEPIIHGGKSTTIYRSGTPAVALIASISKALRLAVSDINDKYKLVKDLNIYLKDNLLKYNDVYINSNEHCVPHILNISLVGVKPESLLRDLENYHIYVSTQTACSNTNSVSKAVYALTKDNKRAESSIRISLSHLTTKEEIDTFLAAFDKCYNHLKSK
ncbi:MAG TPA: cysteine desulfurase [Tenericutes bacterium]|nr:cysteine desulfurase [Mycoplasmatota bacterium]